MWRYNYPDELYHWQYIKRIKVNGKWRYFYDEAELKKYEQGLTTVTETPNANGGTTRTVTSYKQTNAPIGINQKTTMDFGDNEIHETVKKQGSIARAAAKVERKVFDTVLKDDSVVRKKVNRGLDWLKRH